MRSLMCLLLGVIASDISAQQVTDCHLTNRADIILDPLDVSNRSYANGEVNFAVVHDGRKNTSDSLFLLVYAPDSHSDKRKCQMIGMDVGRGYANIDLRAAQAEYSAVNGLTVAVPAQIFLEEQGFSNGTQLLINVNRASNEIIVSQELGNE